MRTRFLIPRMHLHNALLIGGASARTRKQAEEPFQCWCALCDKPVTEEQVVDAGSKRMDLRVKCHGAEDVRRFYWDSDSETMQDALRVVARAPFFDPRPQLTTAETYYSADATPEQE